MTEVEFIVDKIIIDLRSRFPDAEIVDDRGARTVRVFDPATGEELDSETY